MGTCSRLDCGVWMGVLSWRNEVWINGENDWVGFQACFDFYFGNFKKENALSWMIYIIGAVGAWIVVLEMRFKKSQTKVAKLEQDVKDAKIKSDMHLLSDNQLDAVLAKDLSSNESEH